MPILGSDRPITQKRVRGFLAKSFITLRRKLAYPMFVEVRDSYSEWDFAAMVGSPPQMDPADEVEDGTDSPPAADFYDFETSWKNRLYKMKFWMRRALFEFDQTGQIFTMLHSAAARMANFPDKLFFHRLREGTGTTYGAAYDTKALFATNHIVGNASAEFSNLLTGTLFDGGSWSNTNRDALAQRIINDFTTAKGLMLSYRDDRGEPFHLNTLNSQNLVILCGPLMEDILRYVFEAERIGATTNIMRGGVQSVVTSNYLPSVPTDAEAFDWYLCYLGERNRPLVYSRFRQRRDSEIQDKFNLSEFKKIEGFEDTSMEDLRELSSIMLETNLGAQGTRAQVDVMQNERFMVAGRWRGEVFPGEFRNIIKVNNAASS